MTKIKVCSGQDSKRAGRKSRLGRDGKVRRDTTRRPAAPAGDTAATKPSSPPDKSCAPADRVEAALSASAEFQTQLDRLQECRDAAARLATGPGGAYLSQQEVAHYESGIRTAEQVLIDARPRGRCSHCGGKGCFCCRHKGYTAFHAQAEERR